LGSVRYGNERGTHKAGNDRRLMRERTGNLVLQDTLERLFVQNLYADIERGLFLVRGENVSLLGEIVRLLAHAKGDWKADRSQDLDKDDYVPPPFEQASVETVFALKKAEDAKRKKMDRSKQKKLAAFGFEGEHHGEAIL
jgi:U6 snRNA-associated Sm-like protein LSm1